MQEKNDRCQKPSSLFAKMVKIVILQVEKLTRNVRVSFPPTGVNVELTNWCNLKCPTCPIPFIPRKERGYMNFGVFKKIVDELGASTNNIVLRPFLGGESLLHPQFHGMISYAKKKKLFIDLHTNGTLLSQKMSGELVQIGLDKITISNPMLSFKNIRYLKREKAGKSKPEIIIQEIKSYSPSQRLDKPSKDFEVKFGPYADGWDIRFPHTWAGEHINPTPYIPKPRPPVFMPCIYLWIHMAIRWDGKVVACCNDVRGKTILGDVKRNKLKQIWNNKKFRTLRSKHLNGSLESIKACRSCQSCYKSYSDILLNIIPRVLSNLIWNLTHGYVEYGSSFFTNFLKSSSKK